LTRNLKNDLEFDFIITEKTRTKGGRKYKLSVLGKTKTYIFRTLKSLTH